ncbi:transcriptional regulator [Neisseria bergeri]|uniref:transcriptional regulator n=1 Tax=Neisseria bergeri TaxID=1906581 RepID=UPI00272B93CE|nr:Cro/CI family transcriptional regulator [Neisseria bergeri]
MNQAIQDAIRHFGSQNRLAKAVGVSQTAVRKWRDGSGLDVRHAQKIEDLTEGRVTTRQISDGIRR